MVCTIHNTYHSPRHACVQCEEASHRQERGQYDDSTASETSADVSSNAAQQEGPDKKKKRAKNKKPRPPRKMKQMRKEKKGHKPFQASR